MRSGRCVGENEKGEDNVLLAEEAAQPEVAPVLIGQFKVRGAVSDSKRHGRGGRRSMAAPSTQISPRQWLKLLLVLERAACGAGAARVNRFLALLDELNYALLVHDESGPIRETCVRVEDSIVLRDLALKIAKEWKLDSVLLGKDLVGGRTVHADPQDLHALLLEIGDISLIRL